MISVSETQSVLNDLKKSIPNILVEHFGKEDSGIMCVLHFLNSVKQPVSAGEISTHMNVSTARVAVLLKKMEAKNLIIKSADPQDARKTIISLTESGLHQIHCHNEKFINIFSKVIEDVGIEKFRQFISLSEEIKQAVEYEILNNEVEK